MVISDAAPFKHEGKPFELRVLRNDGYAWGRVIAPDGRQFDVSIEKDVYDDEDEDAAEAFIEAIHKGADLEPALRSI